MAMTDDGPGGGMRDLLMELLEFRVVLGALVTTMDGLVIAHAGLSPEDAEILAAASSSRCPATSCSRPTMPSFA